MLEILGMRHPQSHHVSRDLSFHREREAFRYMNELSKARSQYRMLGDDTKRARPDARPRVVVRIALSMRKEFCDESRARDSDGKKTCKPDQQPEAAGNAIARAHRSNECHGSCCQRCGSRVR